MCDVQKAKCFVDLAKLNKDNLWKRRQLIWKLNLSLWAALIALCGYRVYGGRVSGWALVVIPISFLFILVMYAWHQLRAFLSDEQDLDWMHYYKYKA